MFICNPKVNTLSVSTVIPGQAQSSNNIGLTKAHLPSWGPTRSCSAFSGLIEQSRILSERHLVTAFHNFALFIGDFACSCKKCGAEVLSSIGRLWCTYRENSSVR